MGTNIAEGLKKRLESDSPDQLVRVNILLRSDLTPAETREAADQIYQLVGGAPCALLERNKSLTATLPGRDVARIAALDNVFWIDLDHEAPLGALLDPEPD